MEWIEKLKIGDKLLVEHCESVCWLGTVINIKDGLVLVEYEDEKIWFTKEGRCSVATLSIREFSEYEKQRLEDIQYFDKYADLITDYLNQNRVHFRFPRDRVNPFALIVIKDMVKALERIA